MPLQQSLNVVQAAPPSWQVAPPPEPLVVVVPPVPLVVVVVDMLHAPLVHDPLQQSTFARHGVLAGKQVTSVFGLLLHAPASPAARRANDTSIQER
jgi:hypothetical protein